MTTDVHAESRRKLAEKTVYTVGEVHDNVVRLKECFINIVDDYYNGNLGVGTAREAIKAITIARKIPVPTKENCKYPNSHILIDIRDEFFENLDMPTRYMPLWFLFNGAIIIYEYDPPYRHFIDYLLKSIKNNPDWLPLATGYPNRWWNGDRQ